MKHQMRTASIKSGPLSPLAVAVRHSWRLRSSWYARCCSSWGTRRTCRSGWRPRQPPTSPSFTRPRRQKQRPSRTKCFSVPQRCNVPCFSMSNVLAHPWPIRALRAVSLGVGMATRLTVLYSTRCDRLLPRHKGVRCDEFCESLFGQNFVLALHARFFKKREDRLVGWCRRSCG